MHDDDTGVNARQVLHENDPRVGSTPHVVHSVEPLKSNLGVRPRPAGVGAASTIYEQALRLGGGDSLCLTHSSPIYSTHTTTMRGSMLAQAAVIVAQCSGMHSTMTVAGTIATLTIQAASKSCTLAVRICVSVSLADSVLALAKPMAISLGYIYRSVLNYSLVRFSVQ
eukprot:GHVU01137355.1.p2 GENE.GHVU01137355.1~~GHVU01137355.1.p2  ORF type:complete len:168 (-),score=7.10 GHVU01137355.1:621-1124(-)